jgi:3-mercaptopyruvate sulfurtransferase SseA
MTVRFMSGKKDFIFVISVIAFVLSACGAQPTQVQPTATPTRPIESGHPITSEGLPATEADVPRVSVEEAKTAFDSGLAVIVDVRHPNNFESSHVAGAVSVPLLQIERDLTSLTLDKEQWIITYCT